MQQRELQPQALVLGDQAQWACVRWAPPDCSTRSRARERPIPGNSSAPKPLRAADQVRGISTLYGRDKTR
eukprot:949103-Heterocapsa_arctica.AAC.1